MGDSITTDASLYSPSCADDSVFRSRMAALRGFMSDKGIDAMIVSHPDNVRYLTSFRWGQHSRVIVTRKGATLVARPTEYQQALEEARACDVTLAPRNDSDGLIAAAFAGAGTVGFEPGFLSVEEKDRLERRAAATTVFQAEPDLVTEMRAVKEPWEIGLIARACSTYDRMMEEIVPTLAPGMSENQIDACLQYAARSHGAEGFWFPSIVVSGPRSALPHGYPSGRRLRRGDFLKIDMGPVYGGMPSDATRTIAFGCTDRMREVYSVVLEAQIATIQACKAGIICEDLHAVSRRIIDRAGLGEYYNHGVGHGVFGPPQVAPGVRRPLVEGMVITVEPGVYIPGYGGVRIEDTVEVTSRGCHVLHTYTKDLIEM